MANARQRVLAAGYLLAAVLFLAALYRIVPGPARDAVTAAAAAVTLVLLAWSFFADKEPGTLAQSVPLLVCWGLGGAAIIYGLTQVTPPGNAQLFVGFVGAGALIAFLGWWSFSEFSFGMIGRRRGVQQETAQERDTRWTRDTVLIFCYVGMMGIALFAIRAIVPAGPVESLFRVLGVGVLIACGSLLSGTLLGFLFGIPRAQTGPDAPPAPAAGGAAAATAGAGAARRAPRPFQVNTNLEQISDWLTKIIVGLGLINLGAIPGRLQALAAYFAEGFGPIDGRNAITLTLIVAFTVCGFLLGYLLTRLFLTGAFTRAESAADELKTIIEQTGTGSGGLGGPPGSGLPPPPTQPPGPPGTGTTPLSAPPAGSESIDPAQIEAALRVRQIAPEIGRGQLQHQVLALADEYNVTRSTMSFTEHRTQLLDNIVGRMRVLSVAASWLLPTLANGKTPGERLAAIAFLQMQPNPSYIGWLGERFRKEQPFLMYHAAFALKNASEGLRREHWTAIKNAIDTAKELSRQDETVQRILGFAEQTLGPQP